MIAYNKSLAGDDLRSLFRSGSLVGQIRHQADFDRLFQFLFNNDRSVVMRAADVIEKITAVHPEFLQKYKMSILELMDSAANKELQWHIAQLIPRLHLQGEARAGAKRGLVQWVKDRRKSNIVRVNALQALYDMASGSNGLNPDIQSLMKSLEKENIPSLNARIRKLRREAS